MITNFLFQVIRQGGVGFMVPLIILSILSLAVILERIYMLSKRVVISSGVIKKIKMAAEGNNNEGLSTILEKEHSIAALILRDVLKTFKPGKVSLKQAVIDSADAHMDGLTARLWMLRAIGHIAPLLGLMGTVVGLAVAFRKIAEVGLSQQSVAGGISMALITTITGLGIALPTLFAEYCLRAWAQFHFRNIKAMLHDFVSWYGEK